jgi:hypothetical protein
MEFWNKIAANLRLYKKPVWPYLVNMLGSHDTVRLHTEVKDGKKASLALLCSLCFEGIPLIYYGDEAAMTGGEDPDNRRAMQWGANPSFIAEVQKLGGLRRRSHVLRCGDTVPVMHRTLLCFERRDGIGTIRITASFGNETETVNLCGEPLFERDTVHTGGNGCLLFPGGMIVEECKGHG